MAFSATRLICFAIISALEEDLRDSVKTEYAGAAASEILPSPERLRQVQERRQRDGFGTSEEVVDLLPYIDFQDAYEALMRKKKYLSTDLLAALSYISSGRQALTTIRNRVAHTRPMEIDDASVLLDTAREMLQEAASELPTLRDTLDRLEREPSYAFQLKISLPAEPERGPQHNLPVPDYDETGFFGRKEERRAVARALSGAYPVISIIGDGGIGKTALAHRVAYDILDDPNDPFESIVWVSAKDTVLTGQEVRRISGAVETSLGLLAQANTQLAGEGSEDPLEELLDYLSAFRVLLILDNLETVLDDRLREFLSQLPVGSKVLITSRIGLGALDNPMKLASLGALDSANLIYKLARTRGVHALSSMDRATIESYAQQMQGHPLYIKWFVAGVQAGRRPEDLLSNNKLLLDFCMSNVYDYLAPSAKRVLASMQALPAPRNQPEWAYLTEYTAEEISEALLQLFTTNFVAMSSQASGQTTDTRYAITEFAKKFLDQVHPVNPDDYAYFQDRQRQLKADHVRFSSEQNLDPYAQDTVSLRSRGDVECARLLRQALQVSGRDPNAALVYCKQAQLHAPSYFEAWRVEGQIRMQTGEVVHSRSALEHAFELAPDNPIAAYHLGVSLVDELADPAAGLMYLQKAAQLDPSSPDVLTQIAWAHYRLNDRWSSFLAARHAYEVCGEGASWSLVTFAMHVGVEHTDWLINTGSLDDAAEQMEVVVGFVEFVQRKSLSSDGDRVLQLIELARGLASAPDVYPARKGQEFVSRLLEIARRTDPTLVDREAGHVKTLKESYGFIATAKHDYFFHRSDLEDRSAWSALQVGDEVTFNPVRADGRWRAGQVHLVS